MDDNFNLLVAQILSFNKFISSLFDRITKLRSQRFFFSFLFFYTQNCRWAKLGQTCNRLGLAVSHLAYDQEVGVRTPVPPFFPKGSDYFNAPCFLNVVNYFRTYYYFLWTTLKRFIISLSKFHCVMAPVPPLFPKGGQIL